MALSLLFFSVALRRCTDDITEMYSKLRSLVLEYLGILPTPTKQLSDVEMPAVDETCLTAAPGGGQMMYGGPEGRQVLSRSAPLPVRRLWSHPSITDSSEPSTNVPNVKSPLTATARGSVVSTQYTDYRLVNWPTVRSSLGYDMSSVCRL